MLNIVAIGDIVGSTGRAVFKKVKTQIDQQYKPDLFIVNGENASGGIGITPETADQLFNQGVDIITSGNHIFKYKSILDYLDSSTAILRPMNYPDGVPGTGCRIIEIKETRLAVINLCGRVFMDDGFQSPFEILAQQVEKLRSEGVINIIVDFHAEATSEKKALAYFQDGKISLLYGTHTHVQTSDENILPGGCGYISDIGFSGSTNSVIGMNSKAVLKKFLTMLPSRFEVGKENPCELNGIYCKIDEKTGKTIAIERIKIKDIKV